jgi:hypothetical protein
MEHNIFISYAWVDDEVYPGGEKGWVSTFVDGLRKHLARELGRREEAERLWLDYEQMRGNDSVTPTIRARLEASRTLVLILSQGYLASAWCQQELAAFIDKFGADSGRIFVVWMSPVEREPEPLRDLLKYRFWYLDERKQPHTRWFPYRDPTDRDYALEQQRLARDLAAKLSALAHLDDRAAAPQAVPMRSVAPETRAHPSSTTVLPRPAPFGDRLVLVDGGAEDRDLIHAIAGRLGQQEVGVSVPLSALPNQPGLKSSDLTRDLREKLRLCDAVLMVYRDGPVDQVSQHLVEFLKAATKAPKGKRPPAIDLCQTHEDPLAVGLRPKGMRVRVVREACADECVRWFLEGRLA